MKARRLKTETRKFKSVSSRIQFLADVQSAKETIEQKKVLTRSKLLSIKYRNMKNLQEEDTDIRKRFITLAYELQDMNSADRMAYLYEDPSFPKEEKIIILNACIAIMEKMQEFEVCETLNRMRAILKKK